MPRDLDSTGGGGGVLKCSPCQTVGPATDLLLVVRVGACAAGSGD